MHWYLVHTKPRQEDVAALNLEKLGVEAFCPRLKQRHIIRCRNRATTSPLFPRYLFSRFDSVTQHRLVTYAQGVREVVRFGSVLAIVQDEIIESIKARINGGCVTPNPASFTAGQILRIEDGPLCGLEAVFEKELSGQHRVALLLRSVSYQVRVIVDRGYVANA
ncbi:MAG: transcription termination/antitermination NusG family protein [Candidatus Tectomicrobia bacterium]